MASQWVEAEDGAVTVQWPVFSLARNLVGSRNLVEIEEHLRGTRGLSPFPAAQTGQAGLSPLCPKAIQPLLGACPSVGLSWPVTATSHTREAAVETDPETLF